MKKKRDTTALVKDLELQIDYLIGYAPSSLHWKQEYSVRKALIDETLSSETTPEEIRKKIYKIQESLYQLRNGVKNEQGYTQYSIDDYKKKHTVKVNEMGGKTSYYIEI